MRLYYFTLFIILFTLEASAQYQHSFHANNATPPPPHVLDMTLQTVYHHSSPTGPTPGLFRRLDLSRLRPKDATYSLSTVLLQHERLNKPAKNYLIQQASSHDMPLSTSRYQPKRIRWNHLGSLTTTNMDILKESVMAAVPDVTNRSTILTLAMMTNNAYSGIDNTTDWYDLGDPWHLVTSPNLYKKRLTNDD